MYAINVNWQEEFDKWENIGRNALESNSKHFDEDEDTNNMQYQGHCEKCELSEDSGVPMMNYAYPLETTPDDAKVLQVMQKTNCTVMYNNDEDKYYLALTGGGMDLSQDVARAYQIIENWIPKDLIGNVSKQPDLSIYGSEWLKLAKQMKKQLRIDIAQMREEKKRWDAAIKEFQKRKGAKKIPS